MQCCSLLHKVTVKGLKAYQRLQPWNILWVDPASCAASQLKAAQCVRLKTEDGPDAATTAKFALMPSTDGLWERVRTVQDAVV